MRKTHTKIISPWKLYLCVLLILLCETAALSFLKQYSLTGSVLFMLGGLSCYALVSFFLIQSFQYEGMGMVNILWSAASVVLVVAAGIILFAETLTMKEGLGMIFVIMGVGILRMPVAKKTKAKHRTRVHHSPSLAK